MGQYGKVIVNHGDTTCYYYMYEFSGYDTQTNLPGQINNACYYYTGENLNTEQDSLIAGLRDGFGEVTFFRNHAYAKMQSEGKALIDLPMPFRWRNHNPFTTLDRYLIMSA